MYILISGVANYITRGLGLTSWWWPQNLAMELCKDLSPNVFTGTLGGGLTPLQDRCINPATSIVSSPSGAKR